MPGTAVLEFDKTTALCQEPITARVSLRNDGRSPLLKVNPGSPGAFPTLLVRDLGTGQVFRREFALPSGISGAVTDLAPGQSLERSFDVVSSARVAQPGQFELTAVFSWADGSAVSPPVPFTVLPAAPRPGVHIVSTSGGLGSTYQVVWLNRARAHHESSELRLSDIAATWRPDAPGTPALSTSPSLAEVNPPARPYLSVPPNEPSDAPWIAWIDHRKLFYLARTAGEPARPESADLQGEDWQIVPPLLSRTSSAGEVKPGASVLLYRPRPQELQGELALLELEAGARPRIAVVGEVPRFTWAESAYLSDSRRQTLFLAADAKERRLELLLSTWSDKKPPSPTRVLHGWDLRLCAAGLSTVRQSNVIRGVVLGERLGPSKPSYALYAWVYMPDDKLVLGDPIPVQMPVETPIDLAVARIGQNGAPGAVLKSAGSWLFCDYDGSVRVLAADLQPPVEILFQLAEMPIVMYTEPGRGFQFISP